MRKIWDFHGGIHPTENKSQSLGSALRDAPLPSQVILPLSMHVGAPAIPCVKIGESVKTGQMVAEPSGAFSAAIHASISGEIIAIEERLISHPSGNPGPAIVIKSDGLDESIHLDPIPDYMQVAPDQLVERVREAGIAGLGGAGFPSHIKIKPLSAVKTLIINGAECEPYITADHALFTAQPEKVIEAVQLLSHIVGNPEQVLIGIEDNKADAIEKLSLAAKNTNVEVVVVPTKYPSGGEKQLIQLLTGLEVPSGKLPANLGILVQNPGTAVAALEAICEGKTLISRITTFVGENLKESVNLRVRIGTPVSEVLDYLGLIEGPLNKIVLGGPMMGFAMPDPATPILKISNCVLVPSKSELPDPDPAQPCIRCGSCAEVCPAQLLPQQLFWFSQAEDYNNLQNHNLFDCIECGACSYVCPSNIPLVQYYRASKGAIREADRERIASDRARRRFEVRNLRVERETQEREEKRAARMKAAKDKQAQSADADLVAAAMARVKAEAPVSEDSIQNKTRALEDRIDNLNSKIEAIDADIATGNNTGSESEKNRLASELANTQAQLQRLKKQNPGPATAPAGEEKDSATAAIERAKAKVRAQAEMPESEKLKQSLESLEKRIEKASERVAQARTESSDTLDALENGLQKLLEKKAEAESRLAELESSEADQ